MYFRLPGAVLGDFSYTREFLPLGFIHLDFFQQGLGGVLVFVQMEFQLLG